MIRRLVVLTAVLLTALFLCFLQNKVLVGTQELQTDIQAVEQPDVKDEKEKTFEIVFKDLGGNKVLASAAERDKLTKRLAGSDPTHAVKTKSVSDVTADHTIRVTLAEDEIEQNLRQRVQATPFKRDNPPNSLFHITSGIDLRGGVEFICQLKNDDGQRVAADEEVVRILRNRLDQRGLTEPVVTRLSNGDVQVVIPGGTSADAARTRKVLETSGRLEFREVLEEYPNGEYSSTTPGDPKCAVVQRGQNLYTFAPGVYHNRSDIVAPKVTDLIGKAPTQFFRLSGPPALEGKHIADANRELDQGRDAIGIRFTSSGATRNHDFTTNVKSKGDEGKGTGRIAIVFDGVVQSDPRVISPSGAQCQITGNFTPEEIESLRSVLRGGSLSYTPEVISQRVVGATLGIDAINRAFTTMFWTIVATLLFLAYYYRRLGLVAVACMLLLTGLTYTTLSIFGATLTLPGIAGLVLSVAMSIDANILIYERIREELKAGKDIPTAIDAGYERAFSVIIDSHLTNMAIGLILYWIGSGPVKGFGLTLLLGVAISLFTNVYVGRMLTDMFCRRMRTITMANLVPELKLPYTGMRKFSYALSILTGAAGLLWFCFGHRLAGGSFERNFDIDFTGGNMAQVIFQQPKTFESVESAIKAAHLKDPEASNLLDPADIRIQPYFAEFGGDTKESRQWIFRGRDEAGSAIEGKRQAIENQRAKFRREAAKAREATPPDEVAAKAAETASNQLAGEYNSLGEQIANRSNEFKNQLAAVFAGEIGAEGDELLSAKWQDNAFDLEFATLENPDASRLTQLQSRLRLDELKVIKLTPAAGSPGVHIHAEYHENPAVATALDTEDPVAKRLQEAFSVADVEGDQAAARANAAFRVFSKTVDLVAKDRLTVARPYPAIEHFSGQVAGQMKLRALLAVLVASIAMLAYIAARYEVGFGVGAVVALGHDLLLTLGLISLLGLRIDMTVIAAILTIIGYSANEIIVNFDRIRENLRKNPLEPLDKLIDQSVAQTIPRTMLTGGSVILALIALRLFGGESLEGFSMTLLIGTILGTYSAVFVASPLLLAFNRKRLISPEVPPDSEEPGVEATPA
jgi:protein-export membrane protein SecD/preprotein translocase SecF subunit